MKYIKYFIVWLGLMPFVFFGALGCFKIFLSPDYALLAAVVYYLVFMVILSNLIDEERNKKS